MSHLGYSQKQTVKVIRTEHCVTFTEKCDAASLMASLKNVPPKAVIVDIQCDDDSGWWTWKFLDETEDPKGDHE